MSRPTGVQWVKQPGCESGNSTTMVINSRRTHEPALWCSVGKATRLWKWQLNHIECQGYKWLELYMHSCIFLLGIHRDGLILSYPVMHVKKPPNQQTVKAGMILCLQWQGGGICDATAIKYSVIYARWA